MTLGSCPVCRAVGLQWNGQEAVLHSSPRGRSGPFLSVQYVLNLAAALLMLMLRPFTDACLVGLEAVLSRGPV